MLVMRTIFKNIQIIQTKLLVIKRSRRANFCLAIISSILSIEMWACVNIDTGLIVTRKQKFTFENIQSSLNEANFGDTRTTLNLLTFEQGEKRKQQREKDRYEFEKRVNVLATLWRALINPKSAPLISQWRAGGN